MAEKQDKTHINDLRDLPDEGAFLPPHRPLVKGTKPKQERNPQRRLNK